MIVSPSLLGDFAPGSVVYHWFTAIDATGAPTTLAGTPNIEIYKQGDAVQSAAGRSLTADYDSITGLVAVSIDTSADGTFYSAGADFAVVISAGTVGGVSQVGYVIARFSLNNRSSLRPTTAGRTLDVSAGGEAALDWANIGSPTTAVDLSGTTIKTATDVEADTANIQTRLPAALDGGRMDSSVGAYQTGLTPLQPTVAGRTLDVSAGGEGGLDWANIGSPTTAQNLSGTTIAASPATLSASERNSVADALLDRDMATGTDSGSPTVRTVRQALRASRNRVTIAGATYSVYKEDDATTSWTASVSTDAAAVPVIGVDPA